MRLWQWRIPSAFRFDSCPSMKKFEKQSPASQLSRVFRPATSESRSSRSQRSNFSSNGSTFRCQFRCLTLWRGNLGIVAATPRVSDLFSSRSNPRDATPDPRVSGSLTMAVPRKKLPDTAYNTTTFLLSKQPEDFVDGHRVKIVIVGSGYTGVAVGVAILFKVCQISPISNLSVVFQLYRTTRVSPNLNIVANRNNSPISRLFDRDSSLISR